MAIETKQNAVNTSDTMTGKTLAHKGGKNWEIDGKPVANYQAMQWMKAKGIPVPVWLEREVRTGKTLEERRAAKAESALRRAAEKSGVWKA